MLHLSVGHTAHKEECDDMTEEVRVHSYTEEAPDEVKMLRSGLLLTLYHQLSILFNERKCYVSLYVIFQWQICFLLFTH